MTLRKLGLNPRALGKDARTLGVNPRALAVNPRSLENLCPAVLSELKAALHSAVQKTLAPAS